MSNNSSSTFQQHALHTSNANDTNGMVHHTHRNPPIVISNLNGSRSSSGSPHASPRPINRPAPSPSTTPTISIPNVGQYIPLNTSLPAGMQQVIPLQPPMWNNLYTLFALQGSFVPTSSQPTAPTTSVAPSVPAAAAPAPITTSKPQAHASPPQPQPQPQPQSPTTTSSASHQSAMHNEASVTQANETNDNGNIRIPPEQQPAANHASTTATNTTPDDHRTINNQSTPETQESNASTENSSLTPSLPKNMVPVRVKAHLFLQASPRDLDVAKRIAIWGKVLKNHKGVRALKAEYGVSTIENVEDQHDTAAQTNIDTEDIDTDVIMENAVNEEVGTITNSATDNVVDEEPYVDIDHSMEENDDQQQPASSVDEEQPKSGMDEQQPTNSVDEQQPTSDVHEQQPTSGVHEQESESSIDEQQQPTSSVDEQQPTSNVDEQEPESSMKQQDMDMRPLPAWRLPDNDMDVDAMDIEAWTNHWKEYDPEYCCICIKNDPSPENKLVYCSNPLCEVVVHQDCYGIVEIPSADEPWYCDRCEGSPHDLRVVGCAVCPSTRGAFRRLKVPVGGMEWIHVGCAVRLPEASFGNHKMKTEIELPGYHGDMWQGHCELCPNELFARYGGYTVCKQKGCNARAHPSCGMQFYHSSKIHVPSFRCAHHRSFHMVKNMDLNPWELWVNMRDDWLQRQESLGFVQLTWSNVMEPIYLHDHPSPDMIAESSKQFVNVISQHLVGLMKKELRNVDRARSSTHRLKRTLCSANVKAGKVCKHVDKVQQRVKRVSFLRDKIRQYSIDIRGFMEMVLLQLDATRSKEKALASAAATKRASSSSSSTQPSRRRKRSLSAESYTTANDQPVSSPITPPTTEMEKDSMGKKKGKGKAVAVNIPKTSQTSAGVSIPNAQLSNSQRPLKKRSKIDATQQSTQKPAATTLDEPNKAETTAMEIETSPQPQPQPQPAVTADATTIDKPITPEMAYVEVETSPSSTSSSAATNEAAKATSKELDAKKADESTKVSVQQKEAVIEEDIDTSMQETQASMATTTTTTTTSEEENQQSQSTIERTIQPGTEASMPIIIDEPESDVEMSPAPTVEKPPSPSATTSMITTTIENPSTPPATTATTTVEESSPPPATTTTATTNVEESSSPPASTTTTVEESSLPPATITTATNVVESSPQPATTTVEEASLPPATTTTTTVEEASLPPATTAVEEPAKAAAEQPKEDASSKDDTQRKAPRKRGMKTRGAKKQREVKETRESPYKPGSKWWIWVEEYTQGLRQREKTKGPLVCKECGQHNIPESTLADLKYNPDELANPSKKPYGYTGTGDHWNPSVFIECIGCKDVYHCGCSAIPVKKYPSKNESFFCEDCLEAFEANKTYKRVGYGLDDRAPQGPRRRQRINYKE
ncbi:hypothetical protein O0I10_006453 [Lichtheimia ornata]|uniref:PHD-type domain-containing protein n=1 Tax=Lichtheimia ornata TaxID=688661 RepID=A0AAD7V320_9FUNG|nr:uncharacterized protein O0I10_006453 [Lichtheimia ornata]KAJ8657925.1 hypothetical protein O0I10_006453 [Lichtheimia ornata]